MATMFAITVCFVGLVIGVIHLLTSRRSISADEAPAVSPATVSPQRSSGLGNLIVLVICGAVLYGAWTFIAAQSGFTDDEIVATKESIKREFEKKGMKVTDVQLIRDGDNRKKLFGMAKLKPTGLDIEVTKSCSATMGDGGQYIWECR